MRQPKSCVATVLTILTTMGLLGCGESPAPKGTTSGAKKGTQLDAKPRAENPAPKAAAAPTVAPKATTAPAPMAKPISAVSASPVDFASLKTNSGLAYKATENHPVNGDVRAALADGQTFQDAEGKPVEGYWCTVAPATMEIKLSDPKGTCYISSVEVEALAGEYGFQECSVGIKTKDKSSWSIPAGLQNLTKANDPSQVKESGVRHIFKFDETAATDVQIVVPKGGQRNPKMVYVRDIDVLGQVK